MAPSSLPKRADSGDFRHLLVNDVPLLDVRAPVEFAQGAFPCSENIPLLDNEQRHLIGIRYKQQGQQAALALGWQLASAEVREQRQRDWLAFAERHPRGYLYCFRGGLRSHLSQQLMAEAGVDYPLVRGGYKAMRRYLLDELARACAGAALIVVGGATGSGKTGVIRALSRALDLEALARHRGSVFGALAVPQPSQIDFENAVSCDWLKLRCRGRQPVFVEDEGRLIGRRQVPGELQRAMKKSPLILLEQPLEQRITRIVEDYVSAALPAYRQRCGERHIDQFRADIEARLERIKKRLGGQRHRLVCASFAEAATHLARTGSTEGYREGVALLLREYYDPMYNYQLGGRQGEVLFRGERDAVIAWAERHCGANTPPLGTNVRAVT